MLADSVPPVLSVLAIAPPYLHSFLIIFGCLSFWLFLFFVFPSYLCAFFFLHLGWSLSLPLSISLSLRCSNHSCLSSLGLSVSPSVRLSFFHCLAYSFTFSLSLSVIYPYSLLPCPCLSALTSSPAPPAPPFPGLVSLHYRCLGLCSGRPESSPRPAGLPGSFSLSLSLLQKLDALL